MDVEPHVAVRECALTRVESHADRNAVAGWPGLAGERSLRRARFDGLAGGPEHREECVTLGPELDTFVVGECLAEDRRDPLKEVGIVAPTAWSSRVEPSISVKRNVTVPVGRVSPTAPSCDALPRHSSPVTHRTSRVSRTASTGQPATCAPLI